MPLTALQRRRAAEHSVNPAARADRPLPGGNWFSVVIRSDGNRESDANRAPAFACAGRARQAAVEVAGRRGWLLVVGDFVARGQGTLLGSAPELQSLAERVFRRPEWPWTAGDGGMLAGVLSLDGEHWLFADPLGSIPLYYGIVHGALVASTNLLRMHALSGAPLDEVGLAEMLTFGFCFGQRTVLQDVACLPPGRTAWWREGTAGARLLPDATPYWKNLVQLQPQQAEERCHDVIRQAARNCASAIQEHAPAGVMLGGLDSRLVLALAKDAGCPVQHTYTFGGPGELEFQVAGQVARWAGVEHVPQPFTGDDVGSPAVWDRLFAEVGTVASSYWHSAGERLAARGVGCGLTGVLGDVLLGGTYFKLDLWTRLCLSLELRDGVPCPPLTAEAARAFADAQTAAMPARNWRKVFAPKLAERLEAVGEQVRDDARQAVEELRHGVSNALHLAERFHMAHRGRFIILGQERTLAASLPVFSPWLDYDLLQFSLTLHPTVKRERRMLRRVLVRRFGSLAALPVPNSLFRYTDPNWLFVLGKVWRRWKASRALRLYRRSKGSQGACTWGGWMASWDALLRAPAQRAPFADYLRHPCFDRAKTQAYLGEVADAQHWLGPEGGLYSLLEFQALLNAFEPDSGQNAARRTADVGGSP